METSENNRLVRRLVAAGAASLGVAALLAVAAVQNRTLTERRLSGGAGIAPRPTQPPAALNFVVVGLGAFRGLAAEALWVRADRLQMEGRYFELVQLANWITCLDPYASEAWVYNAWNLSYNISALMLRHEDRLRWVFHGIRLLRDEALLWNPGDAQLCRELAWLYLNKVGSDLDEAAPRYRQSLATEAAPLLGPEGGFPVSAAGREAILGAFRLDAARVSAIEAQTGPLDWRAAESHALYWAWAGMERAADTAERFKSRRLACHALMALYARGRLAAGEAPGGAFRPSPNPDVLPALLRLLEAHYTASPTPATRRLYGTHLLHALRKADAAGDAAQRKQHYERLLKIAAEGYMLPSLDVLLRQNAPGADFLAPRHRHEQTNTP